MLRLEIIHFPESTEGILVLTWNEYTPLMRSILERSLINATEVVYKTKITRIVLDCNYRFLQPTEQEFTEIMAAFIGSLTSAGLLKLAYIGSEAQKFSREFWRFSAVVNNDFELPFELKYFSESETALEWLKTNTFQRLIIPVRYIAC